MSHFTPEEIEGMHEQDAQLKIAESNLAELRQLLKIIVPHSVTLSPRSLKFVKSMAASLRVDGDGVMVTPMQLRWLRSLAAVITRQESEESE